MTDVPGAHINLSALRDQWRHLERPVLGVIVRIN